jgi:hypothetical protein
MTSIGEVKTNNHGIKSVWSACEKCGKERWTRYSVGKNKAEHNLCISCSAKLNPKKTKGEHNGNWKGGRYAYGKEDYVRLRMPNHPNASKDGMISEHRYVMEQKIGRYLLKTEHVHHINGIKSDNRIENLKLVSPANHHIYNSLCSSCELRKEIRLLRWEMKQLKEALQLKLKQTEEG